MCWIVIGIYSFTKLQTTQAQLLSYNKQTPKQAKKQTNQVFCRGCQKQEPLATSKRGCQARICVHAFHGSWGNKDFPRGALEAWPVTWAWRLRCSPVWCHAAEGGSWRTSTGHPAAVDGASGGAMMVGQPCKRAMIGLGQIGKKNSSHEAIQASYYAGRLTSHRSNNDNDMIQQCQPIMLEGSQPKEIGCVRELEFQMNLSVMLPAPGKRCCNTS